VVPPGLTVGIISRSASMFASSLEGHLHRRCGGRYAHAAETVTLRISGMAASVERALFRCGKCGDEHRTVEQREAAELAAIAEIRRAHALLTPKEIRRLREQLGLTHQQLGDLLYGTPKGIVEGWERGRYLQNQQADAMLRSFADREVLARRAAKAGVTLPDVGGQGSGVETAQGPEPESESVSVEGDELPAVA
jgi:putative zinc finger/helix-turn-helix YgiT family protein